MEEVEQGGSSMPAVRHISTCTLRHSRTIQEGERRWHLNPYELFCLSIHYIQKGLLFPNKPLASDGDGEEKEREQSEGVETPVIALLKGSLTATLDHFYPLCGRLATVQHADDGTISVYVDCNNQGAEFVHAAADVTVSDLLAQPFTPRIVRLLFPLNDAIGHEGHYLPLLAVQVTEIRDGYFIGCSMNHSTADGSSFWHFLNSWSAMAREGAISLPPIVDRWFPEPDLHPPLRFPKSVAEDVLINRPSISGELEDAVFHFPRRAIGALKARANAEAQGVVISSLQALLAHVWRATTRARGLPPDCTATYGIAVGFRQRLRLPSGYLGSLMQAVSVTAVVGELLGQSLGQVAGLLNRGIATQTGAVARDWAASWAKAPCVVRVDGRRRGFLFTGSSPRFDVYGNDFGWGKPVAVRSGVGNKFDGKVTIFPGADEGSMDLEMYLPREVLLALMADEEFMAIASLPSTKQAAATMPRPGDTADKFSSSGT